MAFVVDSAKANWQYYDGYNVNSLFDDGARFVISGRGGFGFGFGGVKNKIGSLTTEYYYNPDTGGIITAATYDSCGTACGDYIYAGYGQLGELPAYKDYQEYSFVAGASLGFTVPYSPQWRIEVGLDHISETDYNVSPLFDGTLDLKDGYVGPLSIDVETGGVQSTVTTDIISLMAFYDFFDGVQKPVSEIIPYIGFGVGYADSKTVFTLSDLYGDLSNIVELRNFGTLDEFGVVQFYKSEINTSNIAAVGALGISYGFSEMMFLDIGARVAYLPRIKWELANVDNTRQREWFDVENMIYVNATIGLRVEF